MMVETDISGGVVFGNHVDNEGLLDLMGESEIQERAAARRKVRYVLDWAERHVVADADGAACWSDVDLRDVEETIGGEGTSLIASECVEPMAAAYGISSRTAIQLMSDWLDLKYRLPMIHRGVEDLSIAPWRARRIANMTHALSKQAAAYVDTKLAAVADSCGAVKIERLVQEAKAMFDPDQQETVEDEAKAAWGVRLDHLVGEVWGGTSRLEIIGDTPTLTTVYDLIGAKARDLLDADRPADEQPSLEHRKIAALAQIAEGAGAGSTTKAFVHLDYGDLFALPDGLVRVGSVEKLGPLTVARLQEWLGTSRFTLQPVLDLRRRDAVDQHDPPEWMRELVYQRDRRCPFRYCDKPARDCDLDHIEAYVEMDDGGPPGQTNPDNLAPICRRHHRAKTHFGWSYVRNRDGSYTWTSPQGHRYTVDQRGTVTRH
ncbi:HNH endonuclease signature motif containing protein [Nocardioides dilutus]